MNCQNNYGMKLSPAANTEIKALPKMKRFPPQMQERERIRRAANQNRIDCREKNGKSHLEMVKVVFVFSPRFFQMSSLKFFRVNCSACFFLFLPFAQQLAMNFLFPLIMFLKSTQ
jgi:hypothetical protein